MITSGLSIVAIERFFSLYLLNIKNAFKMDYGNKFVKIEEGGLNKYAPQTKQEVEDIKIYQQIFKKSLVKNFNQSSRAANYLENTSTTLRTEQHMTSTRKLLMGDELGNTGMPFGSKLGNKSVIQEEEQEDENDQNGVT